MIITTEAEYEIGQIVYLKTDREQFPRIVIGYYIFETGLTFSLSMGENTSSHYAFEISETKDVAIAVLGG